MSTSKTQLPTSTEEDSDYDWSKSSNPSSIDTIRLSDSSLLKNVSALNTTRADSLYDHEFEDGNTVIKKKNTRQTPDSMKSSMGSATRYLNEFSTPITIGSTELGNFYDANVTDSTIKNTPTREKNLYFNDISPISPRLDTPRFDTSVSNSSFDNTSDSLTNLFKTSPHASDYDITDNTLSLMTNSSFDDTNTTTPVKNNGGYKSRKYRTTKKRRKQQKKRSRQQKKRSSQKKKKQLRKRTKKYNKK